MERCTTRAEFCQAIHAIAERFADELWGTVVETGNADADAWMRTQCGACQRGTWPVLREIGVDVEGFTPALHALATLASVVEPYEAASTEVLGRMAGVRVSTEKMQALVRDEGARATAQLTAAAADPGPARPAPTGPLTVGIDGGMIVVDKRWQEVKLACVYDMRDRVETPTRGC